MLGEDFGSREITPQKNSGSFFQYATQMNSDKEGNAVFSFE